MNNTNDLELQAAEQIGAVRRDRIPEDDRVYFSDTDWIKELSGSYLDVTEDVKATMALLASQQIGQQEQA